MLGAGWAVDCFGVRFVQDRRVIAVPHESYGLPSTFSNDVALLYLRDPITTIEPISLAAAGQVGSRPGSQAGSSWHEADMPSTCCAGFRSAALRTCKLTLHHAPRLDQYQQPT